MKFNATRRDSQGSSASRRLRHAGQVPAIVYGGDAEPLNISLDHNEIFHALRKDAFHSSILDMQLDGRSHNVLLRAVQWHPYKQQVMHLDFQRVVAAQPITTKVPLNFINGDQSPAVKLASNIISHVMTELEITCLPADLPTAIEIDLGAMEGSTAVHLADITLPKGVTFVGHAADPGANPALAVATIKAGAVADEAEAEDGADGDA